MSGMCMLCHVERKNNQKNVSGDLYMCHVPCEIQVDNEKVPMMRMIVLCHVPREIQVGN